MKPRAFALLLLVSAAIGACRTTGPAPPPPGPGPGPGISSVPPNPNPAPSTPPPAPEPTPPASQAAYAAGFAWEEARRSNGRSRA